MLRHSPAADGAIVSLVASGRATTRASLAHALGWAPSTVSTHVQRLIDDGVLKPSDNITGNRGRPAGCLTVADGSSQVVAIDLGGRHASVGLLSLTGVIEHREAMSVDLAEGPVAVLEKLAVATATMVAARPASHAVRAVGLAIPGPVDPVLGVIRQPARMPGWDGFAVRDWLNARLGWPVFIENDANLMAYAEHVVRQDGMASTVTVKAGTGIGAGIIVGGAIYRGATCAAGDITHYKVAAADDNPCSCGNRGCLETVASGAALVAALRAQGMDVATTRDVVNLARSGDPTATTAVRQSGANLGRVLCAVVNFFNPRAIYLGGLLPTVEPFVAAVRAELYQGSHPLATRHLTVEPTRVGADGVLVGGGRLAVENSLGKEHVYE